MPPLRSLARLAPAILVLSSALPHRASAQEASRDSSPPTLFGRLGLRGMHLSMGGMTVPYEGHRAGALQFRYVFTPKRWPAWSVAYAGNAVVKGDTTAYRAPGAQNFHPEYCVATQEVELQRRWRLQKLVHPLATASAGSLKSFYCYMRGGKPQADHRASAPVATLAAGAEVNLARWARLMITTGYRAAGRTSTQLARNENSGFVVGWALNAGKF